MFSLTSFYFCIVDVQPSKSVLDESDFHGAILVATKILILNKLHSIEDLLTSKNRHVLIRRFQIIMGMSENQFDLFLYDECPRFCIRKLISQGIGTWIGYNFSLILHLMRSKLNFY